MKRTDIKLNTRLIKAYAKREHYFQSKVYAAKIHEGKMTPLQANQNYAIIKDLHDLAEIAEKKGYTWQEVLDIISQLPDTRKAQGAQKRIF